MVQYSGWAKGSDQNWLAVGMAYSWSRVTNSSNTATLTVRYYGKDRYHFADFQTLHRSGVIDGDYDFNNNHGTNGNNTPDTFQIGPAQTYVYHYGANSYGKSPGSVTITARITGAYNGASPKLTLHPKIPVRPVRAPVTPGDTHATYVSDSTAKITWNRESTAARPVTKQRIKRYTWVNGAGHYDDGVIVSGKISGKAESFTDKGLSPNGIYYWNVQAGNSEGWSGWNSNGDPTSLNTTPAPPRSVKSRVSSDGGSVITTWDDNDAYDRGAGCVWDLQESVDGGDTWSGTVTGKTSPYVDNNPPAGGVQYRVRTHSLYATSRYSAWVVGNKVSTITAPNAPTNLTPNGAAVDLDHDVTLAWQHNDGGDGADLSQFTLQYSDDGGDTWNALSGPQVEGTTPTWVMPGGTLPNGPTYQWRVHDWGIVAAGVSPWSTAATFKGSAAPVVTVTAPSGTIHSGHVTAKWAYTQAQGSKQQRAVLKLYEGETLVDTVTVTGTGTSKALPYYCQDGKTYTLSIVSTSQDGIGSAEASVSFTIDVPLPAAVNVETDYQPDDGSLLLHLTAADPESAATVHNLCPLPTFKEGYGDTSSNGLWARVGNPAEVYEASSDWSVDPDGKSLKITPGSGSHDSGAMWDTTATPSVFQPGVTYTISATIHLDEAQADTSNLNCRSICITPVGDVVQYRATAPNEPGTHRVDLTFTVDPNWDGFYIRLYNGQSSANPTPVYWDHIMLVEGTEPGEYFDGDSDDIDGWDYGWDGTPYMSGSTGTREDEAVTVAASVQRSTDGGATWVTLAENVPLPADVVDPLPLINGSTTYRVVSISEEPAYRINHDVTMNPGVTGWVYVNWGDAFQFSARMRSFTTTNQTRKASRVTQQYAGQELPGARFGLQKSRSFSVAGSILYPSIATPDPSVYDFDSTLAEWETMYDDSQIICYRDGKGRRLFGIIDSDFQSSDPQVGQTNISFDLTQTGFVETYGEPVEVG